MDAAIPIESAPAVASATRARPRVRRLVAGRLRWIAPLAAVAAVAGGLAYLHTWPPLAIVQSGSMAPAIKTGDIVVLQRLDRAPRIGDVVSVTVPDEARARFGYPAEVVHRVVRVAPDGTLTTKGDARKQPDPFTVRHVNERVVFTIPAAGRAVAFLTSTLGLVWLGLGFALLLVLPMFEQRRLAEADGRASIAELHAALRSLSDELAGIRDGADARLDWGIESLRQDARATQERLDALSAALAERPEHLEQRPPPPSDDTRSDAQRAEQRPPAPSDDTRCGTQRAERRPPACGDEAAWSALADTIASLERPTFSAPAVELWPPRAVVTSLARPRVEPRPQPPPLVRRRRSGGLVAALRRF